MQKYDLKHKNLIWKCSLISSSMIEHKSNYTFKILQVFETLMQLTTQNNESVSYDKTQIEKKTKSNREGIENSWSQNMCDLQHLIKHETFHITQWSLSTI